MKKKKLDVEAIALTIMLVLIVLVVIECFNRLPKNFNTSNVRSISEIHEAIESNDSVSILISDASYTYYDIHGNCYLNTGIGNGFNERRGVTESIEFGLVGDDGCDVNENGISRHGVFLIEGDASIELYINIYIQNPLVVTFVSEDGYYVIDYFRNHKSEYKGFHVNKYLEMGSCKYFPYDVFSTTCEGKDIKEAEAIYNEFRQLLDEIGIAEEELIIYLEWYVQEVDMVFTNE